LRTRASTVGGGGNTGSGYSGNILSGTTARNTNTNTITSANVEDDYIESYYSTLIPASEVDGPQFVNVQTGQPMSMSPTSVRSAGSRSVSPRRSFSQTSSPHPYAYAFSPSHSPSLNQGQEIEFEYDVEREERERGRAAAMGTGTGAGRRNLEAPRIPTSTIYSVSPIPLSPFVNAGMADRDKEKDRERGKGKAQALERSDPSLFENPRAPPEIPQSPTPNNSSSPRPNFSYPIANPNSNPQNQYSQHYIPAHNHNPQHPYSQTQQRYDPTQSSQRNAHLVNHKSSVRNSLLKAISTPNLRAFARQPQPVQPSSAIPTTGGMPPPIITTPTGPSNTQGQAQKRRQRWLSPETWCDALLFPRPRFAVRVDEDGNRHSGLVISPPGTPIVSWKPEHSGAGFGGTDVVGCGCALGM
jgi:hypothetical protein